MNGDLRDVLKLRATKARVHLDALAKNLHAIRRKLGSGVQICAAVKADAYGHGVIPVARRLRLEGVEALGVAAAAEGVELRRGGDTGTIIVLGHAVPDEAQALVEYGMAAVAGDRDYLEVLETAAAKAGGSLDVHLKVDTGMNRIGCRPDDAPALAKTITASSRLRLTGLATHYPVADEIAESDRDFTAAQSAQLRDIAAELRSSGIDPGLVHAANSGAVATGDGSGFTMARPGIALYGYGLPPDPKTPLTPVMELVTRIVALKTIDAGETVSYGRSWRATCKTVIATIPVGYADGLFRNLSGKAEVMIGGVRYPMVGRVCMDQVMVNLGPKSRAKLHDEVTLFGPDPAGPDAAEWARLLGTIPYEITCAVSSRVPRIHRGKGAE